MAEVKVLIEGYAKEINGEEYASSSVTLIQNNNLNILVDVGMNRKLLIDSLAKESLTAADINYVILTHYHMDHSLLAGIFENAKVLYAENMHSFDGQISEMPEGIFGPDIKILKTPGHNSDCRTVLVKTDGGTVAVCADVFWWPDGEEQKIDRESLMERDDQYATDIAKLKESRKTVLEIADYIIPGHGKPFKFIRNS